MGALKLTHDSEVDSNGHLPVIHRNNIAIDLLRFVGRKVTITIELFTNKRSNLQNNAYWGLAVPIIMKGFRDIGYPEMNNKDRVNDYIKATFLRDILVSEIGGVEPIGIIKSTSDLNTVEFIDLYHELQVWAKEFLDAKIPDPDPQWILRAQQAEDDRIDKSVII